MKTQESRAKALADLKKKVAEFEKVRSHYRHLEKSFEKTKVFIQSVLDSLAEPITVIGEDHVIKWANHAAREVFLKGRGMHEGMLCYQCMHRDTQPCTDENLCPLREVKKSGEPAVMQHEHFTPDGEKRVFEISATPLRTREGVFLGIVEASRDVTERNAGAEQREKLISELQQALAEIKVLRGLIPVCAWCRKIRDDNGFYKSIEDYLENHDVHFTHGICPTCLEKAERERIEGL